MRRNRRLCVLHWCGKPARKLKHVMEHGTNEPYFCSLKHAAFWALTSVCDTYVWCPGDGGHWDDPNGPCDHVEDKVAP